MPEKELETRSLSPETRETRFIEVKELRVKQEAGKPPIIVGRAAPFNSLSQPMQTRGKDGKPGKTFREKIAPGAFKKSIAGGSDIRAMVRHDPDKVLARSSKGKVRLSEDKDGLSVEIEPADTTLTRDTIEDVKHGNLSGMSIGFGDPDDEWAMGDDGMPIRTLTSIPLGEVSLTGNPAYEDTTVDVRDLETKLAKIGVTGETRCGGYGYDSGGGGDVMRSCSSTLGYLRSCGDVVRGLQASVAGLGRELTPAESAALYDVLDESDDLSDKCDALQEACAEMCGWEGDEDEDESAEMVDEQAREQQLLSLIQRSAESGQSTAALREQLKELRDDGHFVMIDDEPIFIQGAGPGDSDKSKAAFHKKLATKQAKKAEQAKKKGNTKQAKMYSKLSKAHGKQAAQYEKAASKERSLEDESETRAGHMTHTNAGPTLNAAGVAHAEELIKAGKVDDGKWSFSAEDEDKLLGDPPDWKTYATWFLSEDQNAAADTKSRYKYPFGKSGSVYRRALAAIRSRASQQDAKPIFDAAGKLMDALPEKKEDPETKAA